MTALFKAAAVAGRVRACCRHGDNCAYHFHIFIVFQSMAKGKSQMVGVRLLFCADEGSRQINLLVSVS